jgi:arylsulfatase A-like enzyme
MIVYLPHHKKRGVRSEALVQNIDIFPTILDYAGITLTDKERIDGKSLKDLLEGRTDKIHDFIYAESGLSRAVTDGKYKYIAWRYPKMSIEKMKNGKIDYAPNQFNLRRQFHSDIAIKFYPGYFDPDQLYDLKIDPYEQHNIVNDRPQLAEKYQAIPKSVTDSFENRFDYSIDPFLLSQRYQNLVKKTKDYDLNNIEWYQRDHGNIVFPPKDE